MRKMADHLVVYCSLIFLCFTLVQGMPKLLSYFDKIQIRTSAVTLENFPCRNAAIFLLDHQHYDLSETEILDDGRSVQAPRISFNIIDIVVIAENRLVIEAMEKKKGKLIYLHCTITEPVVFGYNVLETYRTINGIQYAQQPNYTLPKVWKYENPGMEGNLVPLMDFALLYIEDVYSPDGIRIMQRRRFTIKSTQNETQLIIFSTKNFGVLPTDEHARRMLLVIEEVQNTNDIELLHYYAIDFFNDSRKIFLDDVDNDTRVDLSIKLFNKINPYDTRFRNLPPLPTTRIDLE